MPEFVRANAASIIITVSSLIVGGVIGWFVNYVFYRLQKKEMNAAQYERLKRARNEILDMLEASVVNKLQLSASAILNLVRACEREHQVSLQTSCDPVALLEDVSLRFHRSRHLDYKAKSEYVSQIEGLMRDITQDQAHKPASNVALDSVHSAIKQGEYDRALQLLAQLERDLSSASPPIVIETAATMSLPRLVTVFAAMASAIIVMYFTLPSTVPDLRLLLRERFTIVVPAMGLAVVVTYLMFRWITLERAEHITADRERKAERSNNQDK